MLEKNNIMAVEIANIVNEAKNNLAKEINKSITYVYWNIGRIIVKHENEDNNRLEYGKEVLKGLSKELTKLLGKGYSYTNLTYMRWFYNIYPDYNKISESLSWSHYIELITIKDDDKRRFYEKNVLIQTGLLENYKGNLILHYLKDYYYLMVKQINKRY